jgi:hypothetical protein
MLYEFILFLAILWILMNHRIMDIALLILFAAGFYSATRKYAVTLLAVVILYGLYVDTVGYNLYNEGFQNNNGKKMKKLSSKDRDAVITIGKNKLAKDFKNQNSNKNKNKNEKQKSKNKKTIDITDAILKEPKSGKPSEKYINKSASALEEEITKNLRMDAGSTFLKAYQSLDPKQIDDMKKDTVELIETQKVLMSTLSNITPVLENSQKMMSMFKNTFGNN